MAKYRIVELADGNGNTEYVVQRRFLPLIWFWVCSGITSKDKAEYIIRSKTISKRTFYIDQDT